MILHDDMHLDFKDTVKDFLVSIRRRWEKVNWKRGAEAEGGCGNGKSLI